MLKNDDLISRKTLIDEISSLELSIGGLYGDRRKMREAMEAYKESVLRIIDEQPTIEMN